MAKKQMRGFCPEFVSDIIKIAEISTDCSKKMLEEYVDLWASWIRCSSELHFGGCDQYDGFFTNGIHGALVHQLNYLNPTVVHTFFNDYQYYKHILVSKNHVVIKKPEEIQKGSLVVMSYPGITGVDINSVLNACELCKSGIFLDCAYYGTVRKMKLDTSNTVFQAVAFSLSKAFDLGWLRAGILFTKDPAPTLLYPQKKEYLYFNSYAVQLGSSILASTWADLLPRYLKPYQTKVCDEMGIEPLPPWFAAQSSDPKWQHRSRDLQSPWRFCIADFILDQYDKDKNQGYFGTAYELVVASRKETK